MCPVGGLDSPVEFQPLGSSDFVHGDPPDLSSLISDPDLNVDMDQVRSKSLDSDLGLSSVLYPLPRSGQVPL